MIDISLLPAGAIPLNLKPVRISGILHSSAPSMITAA
jgi:hypothetical protein